MSTCTPLLNGGLGNILFEVASVYGIAKTKNCILVLDRNMISPNAHSNIDYFETIFQNIYRFIHHQQYTKLHTEKQIFLYDFQLLTPEPPECVHELYTGHFQNYRYFMPYLEEFKNMLVLPQTPQTDTFFIHFRFGDYLVYRDNHFVDLRKYYRKCIEIIHKTNPNAIFSVFSNDIEMTRKFIEDESLINIQSVVFVEEKDELISLSRMMNCKLGGICANSTFSWWAGLLNSNPDKKIFFPDQMFPKTSQYRYADISGLLHPSFTIVETDQ